MSKLLTQRRLLKSSYVNALQADSLPAEPQEKPTFPTTPQDKDYFHFKGEETGPKNNGSKVKQLMGDVVRV